jgi:hypothetical protein
MIGYEADKWGISVNIHDLTDERHFVAANGPVLSSAIH